MSEVQELGVQCTERTFWKYHKLGLLPEAQKKRGEGNVAYFPDDTPLRLWFIEFLTKKLEFSLSEVSRVPWHQFASKSHNMWIPGDFALEAKNRYHGMKDQALVDIVEKLLNELKRKSSSERANVWTVPDRIK